MDRTMQHLVGKSRYGAEHYLNQDERRRCLVDYGHTQQVTIHHNGEYREFVVEQIHNARYRVTDMRTGFHLTFSIYPQFWLDVTGICLATMNDPKNK